MPKTLLRGLDLIETVGVSGPLTISEISRQLGIDISTVSRTVAACEREGWLVRQDGRIGTGPRCALLGLASPATRAIRAAEPLVRTIATALAAADVRAVAAAAASAVGASTASASTASAVGAGVAVTASALVGRETMILASAAVDDGPAIPIGVPSRVPLYVLADGLAIAAQLSAAQLDALLPADPFPGLPAPGGTQPVPGSAARSGPRSGRARGGSANSAPGLARTRRLLDEHVRRVRAEGFSRDLGAFHPSIGCIARPWPAAGLPPASLPGARRPGADLPAAIACTGPRDEVTAHRRLIETLLIAATQPGATPQDIIQAATQTDQAGTYK